MIGIIALVWIACGVISYGSSYAYFMNEYPALYAEDRERELLGRSSVFGIFGAVSIATFLVLSAFGDSPFKHGLQFSGGPRDRGAP